MESVRWIYNKLFGIFPNEDDGPLLISFFFAAGIFFLVGGLAYSEMVPLIVGLVLVIITVVVYLSIRHHFEITKEQVTQKVFRQSVNWFQTHHKVEAGEIPGGQIFCPGCGSRLWITNDPISQIHSPFTGELLSITYQANCLNHCIPDISVTTDMQKPKGTPKRLVIDRDHDGEIVEIEDDNHLASKVQSE